MRDFSQYKIEIEILYKLADILYEPNVKKITGIIDAFAQTGITKLEQKQFAPK